MGKKRQQERRRAELERQAAKSDVSELRRRLAQSPRAVKGQLLALLSRPGEPEADLQAVAAEAAGALRRDGALDDAAKLLELAGPRSRALRIEIALLAFARGDDAALSALAEAHDDVNDTLGPLVALTRGSRPRPAAPGSPEGALALDGLARIVAAAAHGDRAGLARAAKGVPEALRPRLFFEVLHAAASLATLGAREAGAPAFARIVEQSSLVRGVPARERALADLLVEAAPKAIARGAVRGGVATKLARDRRAAEAISARQADAADPMAAALHLARAVGESAFAVPAEGALLVGFARLADGDEAAAVRSFDAAIAAGADLIEALRGRWLALAAGAERAMAHGERVTSDAASAAETLARALRARPGASPYAVLAAVDAARRFALSADGAGVARADALARSCALPGVLPPEILAELEVHQLRARLSRPDEALRRRVVELTTSMPGLVDAWELRLDLAMDSPVAQAEVDALVIEAFAKTRDPGFRAGAERAEKRRAKAAPPSAAASLLRDVVLRLRDPRQTVVSSDGKLDPSAEARLEELPPGTRHAARAALIVELGIVARWSELRAFFARAAREATNAELGDLLVAFAFVPDEAVDRPFVAQLQALSMAGLAHPDAMRYAFTAALAASLRQGAQAALAILAPHLASSELTRCRKLMGGVGRTRPPQPSCDQCDAVIGRLHAALEPGYSLDDAVFGDAEDRDDADDADDMGLDAVAAQLRALLEDAPPAVRAGLLAQMQKLMAGKGAPSEHELAELSGAMAPGAAKRRKSR